MKGNAIRLSICMGLFSLSIFAGGCETAEEPFVGEEGGETAEEGGESTPSQCDEEAGMVCGEECFQSPDCGDEGEDCPAIAIQGIYDENCDCVDPDTEIVCEAPSPCDGKACGEVCSTCPPGEEVCPAVEEYCDADGQCSGSDPICEVEGCEEADCGPQPRFDEGICWDGTEITFSCQEGEDGTCGWKTSDCPENPCNLVDCEPTNTCEVIEGEAVCVPLSDDPCEGKVCGDTCSNCPPDAPCPAVEEFCNADGECTSEEPQCEEDLCAGFIPPCSSDDECPGDMICSFDGCNPSSASCDPETGLILQTDDCGGGICTTGEGNFCDTVLCEKGYACNPDTEECEWDPCAGAECGTACAPCDFEDPECVAIEVEMFCNQEGACETAEPLCGPVEDLCVDFIPPCVDDNGCPGDMFCSFEGCNTSTASCDPATGDIISTPDCSGGVCTPKEQDLCADFIPPCNDSDECPGGMVCSFEGCNPSDAFCDPETGAIGSTDDCGGGQCIPGCEPGSSFPAADGCNTCICPESGVIAEAACTEMACIPNECKSSSECGLNEFCDFPGNSCGIWGEMGTCTAKPDGCNLLGGPGFCGCDGGTSLTQCDLEASGQDVFAYGGCDNTGEGNTFLCGDIQCPNDSWCTIAFNDVAGPDQPEYYTSCNELDDSQTQGECSTFFFDTWETCYDSGGFTIIFYPGG